jgi:hypothetical protein
MMKQKLIVMLCALFVTGIAHAECPSNLSKAEMAQCKDIESSGVNYQQWKKDQKEMADESTKSPITGEDVRSIEPAAGTEEPGSKMDQ